MECFILAPAKRNLYCPAIKGELSDAIREASCRAVLDQCTYTVLEHMPGGLYRVDTLPVCTVNKHGRIVDVR